MGVVARLRVQSLLIEIQSALCQKLITSNDTFRFQGQLNPHMYVVFNINTFVTPGEGGFQSQNEIGCCAENAHKSHI